MRNSARAIFRGCRILTSPVVPAINVDVMEIGSMRYRLPGSMRAAQFTTAIARMLGKAVKVRYCPATVSAASSRARRIGCGRGRNSARSVSHRTKGLRKPLETIADSGLVFGKVAEEGASQETGPRRQTPLAFRGERRSSSCLSPHWHALA
jgi:hypothetical protein